MLEDPPSVPFVTIGNVNDTAISRQFDQATILSAAGYANHPAVQTASSERRTHRHWINPSHGKRGVCVYQLSIIIADLSLAKSRIFNAHPHRDRLRDWQNMHYLLDHWGVDVVKTTPRQGAAGRKATVG